MSQSDFKLLEIPGALLAYQELDVIATRIVLISVKI